MSANLLKWWRMARTGQGCDLERAFKVCATSFVAAVCERYFVSAIRLRRYARHPSIDTEVMLRLHREMVRCKWQALLGLPESAVSCTRLRFRTSGFDPQRGPGTWRCSPRHGDPASLCRAGRIAVSIVIIIRAVRGTHHAPGRLFELPDFGKSQFPFRGTWRMLWKGNCSTIDSRAVDRRRLIGLRRIVQPVSSLRDDSHSIDVFTAYRVQSGFAPIVPAGLASVYSSDLSLLGGSSPYVGRSLGLKCTPAATLGTGDERNGSGKV